MTMIRWLIRTSFLLALVLPTAAQIVILSDDFEDTTLSSWQINGWGASSIFSHSPSYSLTESPVGNYPANALLTATSLLSANLSDFLGAQLQFWARYQIELAFDLCRVEVTRDGQMWVPLGYLTGFQPSWQLFTYDLGAFAGLNDVRVRFRFFSDFATSYDGIYIDDLAILGLPEDQSGPLILHRATEAYEGSSRDRSLFAEIWDASGVLHEEFYFRLDGGPFVPAPQDSLVGERYYHTIPAQESGVLVEYYFFAVDATPQNHVSFSDTFAYLAGDMLIQDDGVSENIFEGPPGYQAAVCFQTHDPGYLTAALLRLYTDSVHPLDSVAVYVWSDSLGLPDSLLWGPVIVYPASTPLDPEAWTWVDLRPAVLQVPDTFHIGVEFSVTGAAAQMALSCDYPDRWSQSSYNIGSGFVEDTIYDYHIRGVVGQFTPDTLIAPTNLTGLAQNDLLLLSWTAPTALDILTGYEIERNDSIIGVVPAPQIHYTDTLTNLPVGTYTYKVRALYSSGASPFSDPFSYDWNPSGMVNLGSPSISLNPEIAIFPNPSNGLRRLQVTCPAGVTQAEITLFDLLGRQIQTWRVSGGGTENPVSIMLPEVLVSGVYLLQARFGGSLPIQQWKVVVLP